MAHLKSSAKPQDCDHTGHTGIHKLAYLRHSTTKFSCISTVVVIPCTFRFSKVVAKELAADVIVNTAITIQGSHGYTQVTNTGVTFDAAVCATVDAGETFVKSVGGKKQPL